MYETSCQSRFHARYFTCFNAILPNLPTLSLSRRVHKTVQYISVSFAVSYTGLSIFFLNSPTDGHSNCFQLGVITHYAPEGGPTYDTTLMAESEELKSLLMKVKEESEKVG